ncbi:MAG: hypothetical protein ACI8PZ_003537 [Myxococcota bacterium]|jgi:hypothetical protein
MTCEASVYASCRLLALAVPVLCLTLGAPAHAGKKVRSRQPIPPPPPAAPALGEANPHARSVPVLDGGEHSLSLEGLSRESTRFHLKVDLSLLDSPNADEAGAVFDQLAADPRWRVLPDRDSRVAVQRTGAAPATPEHGYHVDGERCWRVLLREGAGASTGWSGALVTQATAADTALTIRAFHAASGPCKGQAAALRVSAAVTLEVYEAGSEGNIPVIGEALAMLPAMVASIRMDSDQVVKHGFGLGLPPGEPAVTAPSLRVTPTPDGAELQARVNPGAPGWAWLVIRSEDAAWEAAAVAAGTVEQVGWSSDAQHGFLVQSSFGAPALPPDAIAELWFLDRTSGEVRQLITAPVTVTKEGAPPQ